MGGRRPGPARPGGRPGVGLGGAVEEAGRSGWRLIGGVLSFQEAVEEPRSVIPKNNYYNNQWFAIMLD